MDRRESFRGRGFEAPVAGRSVISVRRLLGPLGSEGVSGKTTDTRNGGFPCLAL